MARVWKTEKDREISRGASLIRLKNNVPILLANSKMCVVIPLNRPAANLDLDSYGETCINFRKIFSGIG